MDLTLNEDDTLHMQQWLRVLPGQRYVGVARWRGRTVLAKLLVGVRAQRHYSREREGVRLLSEQGLTTPELLSEGCLPDEGAWLLFDYLDPAESLDDAWQAVAKQPVLSVAQRCVLNEALTVIAQMHRQGLWQDDLHLDNLLRYDARLYLIDGGGIRSQTPGKPLSQRRVVQNLGVFFAQLPVTLEPHLALLLAIYRQINDQPLSVDGLRPAIDKVRRWRMADLMAKTGRDCSLFSVQRSFSRFQAVKREELAFLTPLLGDLDGYLARGTQLKGGGTATVARVTLDERELIIKRYNIKGAWHWLTRFWRPSRAWRSWREGHRLQFLGIATATPLAMLEMRRFGLRGKAYLITENLDGRDIIDLFKPYQDTVDGLPQEALRALDELFGALIRERISHGDLKGNNLFWQADGESGQWTLIDLDAMRRHRTDWGFARAYARDRSRFLRNWPQNSPLHRLLAQRIPVPPFERHRTI